MKLYADYMHTQHRLYKCTLCTDNIHTFYRTTPHFKQTCCTLSSNCNSSMHQVCICTLICRLICRRRQICRLYAHSRIYPPPLRVEGGLAASWRVLLLGCLRGAWRIKVPYRLKKCAKCLQMHTLCRLNVQTFRTPEMIF
jgi:hypothetical protein